MWEYTYAKYATTRVGFLSRHASKYRLFISSKQGLARHLSKYRVLSCFVSSASFRQALTEIKNKKQRTPSAFFCCPCGRLLAAADAVATAVHDEEPRENIADIAATATHQEQDEDIVVSASTICSTVCKKAVHYVNLLFGCSTSPYARGEICVRGIILKFWI